MMRVRAGRVGGDNTKGRWVCAHALHSRRMDMRHKLSGIQTQDSGRVVHTCITFQKDGHEAQAERNTNTGFRQGGAHMHYIPEGWT